MALPKPGASGDLSAKLEAILGRFVELVRLKDAELDPYFLAGVLALRRALFDREDICSAPLRREAGLQRRAARQGVEPTPIGAGRNRRLLAARG